MEVQEQLDQLVLLEIKGQRVRRVHLVDLEIQEAVDLWDSQVLWDHRALLVLLVTLVRLDLLVELVSLDRLVTLEHQDLLGQLDLLASKDHRELVVSKVVREQREQLGQPVSLAALGQLDRWVLLEVLVAQE